MYPPFQCSPHQIQHSPNLSHNTENSPALSTNSTTVLRLSKVQPIPYITLPLSKILLTLAVNHPELATPGECPPAPPISGSEYINILHYQHFIGHAHHPINPCMSAPALASSVYIIETFELLYSYFLHGKMK